MTNISKNKLPRKTEKKITEQFIQSIARFDEKTSEQFFYSFFTPTERLLFAKRMAILYLLRKGLSHYRISQLLKVSKTTVSTLDIHVPKAEKIKIITTYEQFATKSDLFAELKDLLVNGMSMSAQRRSKWLREFEQRNP